MYVVTLEQDDLTWLAFAAGIAAGSGNQAAHASLFGILARIQPVSEDAVQAGSGDDDIPGEDFGGTLDPNFMPPTPTPPSRPADEFGPGRAGVNGTPIA